MRQTALHISATPRFSRRLRQENPKFQASLGYTARCFLLTKINSSKITRAGEVIPQAKALAAKADRSSSTLGLTWWREPTPPEALFVRT